MNSVVLRYAKGQPIPEQVIRALLFTGKVGFLNFEIWDACFAVGSNRWRRMHIDYLISEGYFATHRNPIARSTSVLGAKGKKLVEELQGAIVSSPPVAHLTHDGVVAKSMQDLDAQGLLQSWVGERQLKHEGVKEYLVSSQEDTLKYPDAVFKINALGMERTVAFEYERERKAMSRYRAILWQYACLANVSMVLFVCEKQNIKTTIQAAMKYLGQTSLLDRLAFADAADWKKNPATACIQLSSGVIELGKVCVPKATS